MIHNNDPETLFLTLSNGINVIEIRSLVRVKASSNYSWLYFSNGKKILTAKTLQWFDETLSGKNFIRVHRTHLVNISFIRRYCKQGGGKLHLFNGDAVDISRRKRSLFLQNWQGLAAS
jgi:two-component system LytT family response regulator